MPYKISVQQIDENGNPKNQELILHDDKDKDTQIAIAGKKASSKKTAKATSAESVKGRFITKDAFVNFLNNYITPPPTNALINEQTPDDEIMAIRFNRHILEVLLALPDCESLVFSKAKRLENKNLIFTIAVVAVDKAGRPLGWDPKKNVFDAEKFASVEWGKGITVRNAQRTLIPKRKSGAELLVTDGNKGIDFQKFFKGL